MTTEFEDSRKKSWEAVLFQAAYDISIAPSLYETINARYATLEQILNGADDPVLKSAHIFPQGSIRLKTAIKPLQDAKDDLGTVDADAVVWLENASTTSAEDVLTAIQRRFQDGKRVTADIEELRRGIRIKYADENPGFHIDVTPARNLKGNAKDCGKGALEVPDRKQGWKASSPIEYSDWLAKISEKRLPVTVMDSFREAAEALAKATKEDMPGYEEYVDPNVLRALIKLIKRTRDVWALNNPSKKDYRPISAILTTLAGLAYEKLADGHMPMIVHSPYEVINAVINTMPEFIKGSVGNWEVRNPADHEENFAEKWNREPGNKFRDAFDEWHATATAAFSLGVRSYGSNDAFKEAFNNSFKIGPSTVDKAVNRLPKNWNLPGRELGSTASASLLAALSGSAAASSKPQVITPTDRLG
jgi:hypothetical protein